MDPGWWSWGVRGREGGWVFLRRRQVKAGFVVLCSSVQNSERGKKIGNAMMTTSRSVVQTGKVVGKDATLETPDQRAHHRCSSRSVCGRGFDQRQVGHVLLVLHAGSASSGAHAGRAPRGGQTLRPRRPTRLQLSARVGLDEHPGPGGEGSFGTGHRSSRTVS